VGSSCPLSSYTKSTRAVSASAVSSQPQTRPAAAEAYRSVLRAHEHVVSKPKEKKKKKQMLMSEDW
jgi:hypothetical protein